MRVRLFSLLLALGMLAGGGFAVAGADPSASTIKADNQAYTAGRAIGGVRTPSTPVPDYRGEWLAVEAHSVGRRSLEPTLGVDTKGTVYYAASWHDDSPAVVLPITEVRRSKDNGKTWTNISPQVNGTELPPTNADPYVFVDQDTDRIFNPEAAGACLYMNFSDNGGDTWLTNPLVCGGFNVDHQSFEAGPFPPALSGLRTVYPNVLWFCSNHVAQAQCSNSVDGGVVWKPAPSPAYLGYDTAAGGLCGGLSGHVEIDSKGRAYLPKGHCGAPYVSWSDDLGATWTRKRVSTLGAASTHIAAAIDAKDNVYVVFWDNVQRLPWVVHSTDRGTTWSEPLMVAPPGVQETNFPEIVAGDAGKIAVVFPGTTSANRNDSKRPWNAYVVVTEDILAADPVFVSTTSNDPATNPVHRGNCGPGRCLPMWDFIDIVTSPVDGGVWASLSDSCEAVGCTKVNGTVDGVSSGMGYALRQVSGPRILTPKPAG